MLATIRSRGRRALAVFLAAHGAAHTLAFVVAWKLSDLKDLPYTTRLFGGHLDVGAVGIRIVGLLWLLAAFGFAFAAFRLWIGSHAATATLAVVTAGSTLLCLTQASRAKIGLAIDVVLLVGLLALSVLRHHGSHRTATA